MRDEDLRAAVCRSIERHMARRRYVFVPEVEIRWSVPARIDALLVADRITGFEFKSEADSLSRLPRQVEAYGAVVERAVLVLAPRHLEAGLRLAPAWWTIWGARPTANGVTVHRVRGGTLNPSVDALAVSSFMPRRALLEVLTNMGQRDLSKRSVDELRVQLSHSVPPKKLLRLARESMLLRADWHRTALLASPFAPPKE